MLYWTNKHISPLLEVGPYTSRVATTHCLCCLNDQFMFQMIGDQVTGGRPLHFIASFKQKNVME